MSRKNNRAESPHKAIVTFDIRIHEVMSDGTLYPMPVSKEVIQKHGINNKAIIAVEGLNRADCIRKIKDKLERVNG